jgi:hypothetical protein
VLVLCSCLLHTNHLSSQFYGVINAFVLWLTQNENGCISRHLLSLTVMPSRLCREGHAGGPCHGLDLLEHRFHAGGTPLALPHTPPIRIVNAQYERKDPHRHTNRRIKGIDGSLMYLASAAKAWATSGGQAPARASHRTALVPPSARRCWRPPWKATSTG